MPAGFEDGLRVTAFTDRPVDVATAGPHGQRVDDFAHHHGYVYRRHQCNRHGPSSGSILGFRAPVCLLHGVIALRVPELEALAAPDDGDRPSEVAVLTQLQRQEDAPLAVEVDVEGVAEEAPAQASPLLAVVGGSAVTNSDAFWYASTVYTSTQPSWPWTRTARLPKEAR